MAETEGIRQKIIIDTDIGGDVDDAYTVILGACSPELDIEGITVVHGGVETRARIAHKFLKMLGRQDIPVFLGEDNPLNQERKTHWLDRNAHNIDFSDIESDFQTTRSAPRAVEFIAQKAAEFPGEISLVTIGPLTNAGLAIREFPSEMANLKNIIAMASSFHGYGEGIRDEYNAITDPEATEIVLTSGIPTLLVGLNVTLQTILSESHVSEIAVAETPMAKLIARMSLDWFDLINQRFTNMHDPLSVIASFEPEIMTSIPVVPKFGENGMVETYIEPDGESALRICDSVDVDRFNEIFFPRITEAVSRA